MLKIVIALVSATNYNNAWNLINLLTVSLSFQTIKMYNITKSMTKACTLNLCLSIESLIQISRSKTHADTCSQKQYDIQTIFLSSHHTIT